MKSFGLRHKAFTEKGKKAQMGIMEYMLLTFFIMVVVVVLVLFISGWQISQVQMGQAQERTQRTLSLTRNILSSQMFAKEESMFDDSKLSALMVVEREQDVCEEFEEMFGTGWFLDVSTLGCDLNCTPANAINRYGECCRWEFCTPDTLEGYEVDIFSIPVNIYRKTGYTLGSSALSRVDIGIARIGVYRAID